MGAYEDPHLAGIEELPVPRLWDEQVVGKCSSKLRAQPAFGCPAEEPDLPLVNDALGNKAERCFLQDILCGKASHLQAAGDPRAVLDEVVIEEGDADFEGVRHGDAVEVMEHVVDEGE